MRTRENLATSLSMYLEDVYGVRDREEQERIISGVLAFIVVNIYKEPFYPVIGVEDYEEEQKKWSQFWK